MTSRPPGSRWRAGWSVLHSAMDALGAREFAARGTALRRLAAGQVPELPAPPAYDPLPVPLPADLFATLAEAVRRRAILLASVVDDLYGAQTLFRDAGLPPAEVLGAPHFLRPMLRDDKLAAPRLALYALDLAIDDRGAFRVSRDHVDFVPGLGHAIALRRFTAAAVPELFRAVTLTSRQPVLDLLRDDLTHRAGDAPVALLEDGTGDAADIALLARALGAMRLRPADLYCFGDAPYFKTLSGAVTLTLLIRCMGALSIDPLEQGTPPDRGIAGLFGAIRRGAVTMLNAPGTAIAAAPEIAETMAQLLPALHRARFGAEDPLAEPSSPAHSGFAAPVAPANGEPSFGEGRLTLRLFAIRTGTAADDDEDVWKVLPGGLGLAETPDGIVHLKDVWVLDRGEEMARPSPGPVLPPPCRPPARAADLPSRVADDLFWLGRQVERLDYAARLTNVTLGFVADASTLPHEQIQRALLARSLARQGLISPDIAGQSVTTRLLRDALAGGRPLLDLVTETRRMLNATADRFSPTMLATIEAAWAPVNVAAARADTAALIPPIIGFATGFAGVIGEDASRSGGFLFVELGRRLERLFGLAGSLAVLLDAAPSRMAPGLTLAIDLIDAALTYDRLNGGPLAPGPALDLLLAAADYPRSLAFQADALAAGFDRLDTGAEAEEARAIAEVARQAAADAARPTEALEAIADRARILSDRLTDTLFAPLPGVQHVDEEGGP